jgi:hypothetical protein
MEVTLTTGIVIVAFVVGVLVGSIAGFRLADYLNDRQKLRAYFREREAAYRERDQDQGGDR